MVGREQYYQVGLCPNCSDHTRQEYISGIHEYGREYPRKGKRFIYGDLHTLSFFRCDGCGDVIGYRTYYADAVEIDEAEKLPLTWVFDLDDSDNEFSFKDHSSHIYSTFETENERQISDHAQSTIFSTR